MAVTMRVLQLVVVLFLSASSGWAQKLRFDNYRVYSVNIENESQLAILRDLEASPNQFVFLDVPETIKSIVQIAVSPLNQRKFEQLTTQQNLAHKLVSSNLQSVIDNERPKHAKREAGFGWEDYHTLEEIYAWVDELVQQHPEVLTVETIGQSYEGRDIKVIKLSHKAGNPGIFIEANIHAREWITSATVTWILNELLTSESPAVREVAENFDWYIIPVANPDGFAYTHTTNRLWRKTRFPHSILCPGADPNRNFDFQWNNGGASDNPCSDAYAGPHPESEIEIKTISNYVKSIADKLRMYLAVHSKGQFILLPFGYEAAPYPPNYKDLMQIGQRAAVDMYKVHRTPYRVGTTADVLYVASGLSIDWAYASLNIPVAATFELRDQGEHGWILPADQIIPNAEELLAAFIAMVDEGRVLGYF